MTKQEQFEEDYINSGTCPSVEDFEKCEDGIYIDPDVSFMFEVWLQQAKRHEKEVAALKAEIAALKSDCATIAAVLPDLVKESMT